ncbi:putative C2 domain superfamily protein [Helianthus anomalus]
MQGREVTRNGTKNSNSGWNIQELINNLTLVLKIIDHDTTSSDDYIGQTTIYLKEVLEQGVANGSAELHPQKYRVVGGSQNFCGDICKSGSPLIQGYCSLN